ncbi:glutathionylspermidine synthase family protein [Arthrobacter caoxuetaonis]|uniref:Glutathionylspermidine synthase family protein n=1 Tax=Arthrobacter caoxuetaonis TaxID=2886935 RepID=A0A9X1SGS7_9MICC|nr:glutathionylspermidine synthase family protein [Arthrobacter caoxuetaonis]MCC3299669.1 glutathionylspermidine synthase family protein [Arthrobacter caoxuetaonis]USQ58990.1 glutathionylspermidine synthase family protein [Arthrobacter caoxuetaonis]
MKRIESTPRPDWRKKIESQGLIYSTAIREDGSLCEYWHEGAYYEFTMPEVEMLESVTEELHTMCIEAARYLATGAMGTIGIGTEALALASWSLERSEPAVYGRFDLAYDGVNPPKMLEYNADTPTGLIEASIAQWFWLQDVKPESDQWNGIHEALINAWRKRLEASGTTRLHVAHAEVEASGEDWMTAAYMLDVARQGGWTVEGINMSDIGWDPVRKMFVDLDGESIDNIFKLYPWEMMIKEEFGDNILDFPTAANWFEPAWKMLLSNKALLAALWHLYPNHPNLLPAYMETPRDMTQWVAKPLHGREGDNIIIHADGIDISQSGDYGTEGWCYQEYFPLPDFDGNKPVLGTWVVDGESVGVGIRESDGPVTDYYCRFVPNVIDAPAPEN